MSDNGTDPEITHLDVLIDIHNLLIDTNKLLIDINHRLDDMQYDLKFIEINTSALD